MSIMKRKNIIIILLAVIGAVYFGMGFFGHSEDNKMVYFEKPDYIKLNIDKQEYVLEADAKAYITLFDEMKQCWESSKTDEGKLEFALLLYLDKEPKDTLKVTCYYEKPIIWTMYGDGSGRKIEAHTYTFFPFDQEHSGYAVISENETYLKDAFIINFKYTEELKELLSQYQ